MNYEIKPASLKKSQFMSIKILDAKELKFDSSKINELSALAYEKDVLYALGDKGYLHKFNILIKDNKIKKLSLLKTTKLKGEKLDSEGLALKDDKLLVSFEKKPKIVLYSKNGEKIKKKKIHKDLRDIKNYVRKNKALESVAYNKKYGIVTAPELPLKKLDEKYHTLYSKKKKWNFLACGSLSGLEFINKDEIMILQRELNSFTRRRIITISKLNLKNNEYKILAKLDTKKGWDIDNFEGLTKIDEKKYLIISDDNDSFFQKTLLVLFEVD
ncbi:esterase-like activity of phytase family protein [Sulfurimonas sp.]